MRQRIGRSVKLMTTTKDETHNTPNTTHSTKMSKFNGTYEMQKSENIDEFLDALGVGQVVNEASKTFAPIVEVEIEGDRYVFRTVSSFKTSVLSFKLNEEFEDERHTDGKQVRSVVVKEGDNKFVQTQHGPKVVTIVREFNKDELIVTGHCDGSTCKFTYKKV